MILSSLYKDKMLSTTQVPVYGPTPPTQGVSRIRHVYPFGPSVEFGRIEDP